LNEIGGLKNFSDSDFTTALEILRQRSKTLPIDQIYGMCAQLLIDKRVQIQNCLSKPELNGRNGTITNCIHKRYCVKLDGVDEPKMAYMKIDNLNLYCGLASDLQDFENNLAIWEQLYQLEERAIPIWRQFNINPSAEVFFDEELKDASLKFRKDLALLFPKTKLAWQRKRLLYDNILHVLCLMI
jgi:hypothetical protein